MKENLKEILVCPDCKRSFKVVSFLEDNGEIADGILSCHCGNIYPIIRTIPRILPDAFQGNPEFLNKYSRVIRENNINIESSKFPF